MKMKCTFMTHLYWIVLLPDCYFPDFVLALGRPTSESRAQRITPHLCLVIPDTVWFRINKTAWTGSWLFVATLWRFDPSVNTSKKFVLGDYFILFRCIKLFHPVLYFLITGKLAIVTVNAQPHNQTFQLCESEALIFAPILVWYVEMVKEPGQQSYKEATYCLVHVMKSNVQIQSNWTQWQNDH